MEEFKKQFINVAYSEFGIKAIESINFEQAFAILDKMEQFRLGAVVVSEERAELCDNPNCEDGIVDRDYYGHPIYCQVCESHN